MNKHLIVMIGLILVVGLASALITYLRAEKMAAPVDLAAKGLAGVRKGNLTFFGVLMPILFGVLAYFIYKNMLARWPDQTQVLFLVLAVGMALVFTVMAAVVFKMRGFTEMLALHILYAAGYGWMMPLLLAR